MNSGESTLNFILPNNVDQNAIEKQMIELEVYERTQNMVADINGNVYNCDDYNTNKKVSIASLCTPIDRSNKGYLFSDCPNSQITEQIQGKFLINLITIPCCNNPHIVGIQKPYAFCLARNILHPYLESFQNKYNINNTLPLWYTTLIKNKYKILSNTNILNSIPLTGCVFSDLVYNDAIVVPDGRSECGSFGLAYNIPPFDKNGFSITPKNKNNNPDTLYNSRPEENYRWFSYRFSNKQQVPLIIKKKFTCQTAIDIYNANLNVIKKVAGLPVDGNFIYYQDLMITLYNMRDVIAQCTRSGKIQCCSTNNLSEEVDSVSCGALWGKKSSSICDTIMIEEYCETREGKANPKCDCVRSTLPFPICSDNKCIDSYITKDQRINCTSQTTTCRTWLGIENTKDFIQNGSQDTKNWITANCKNQINFDPDKKIKFGVENPPVTDESKTIEEENDNNLLIIIIISILVIIIIIVIIVIVFVIKKKRKNQIK